MIVFVDFQEGNYIFKIENGRFSLTDYAHTYYLKLLWIPHIGYLFAQN